MLFKLTVEVSDTKFNVGLLDTCNLEQMIKTIFVMLRTTKAVHKCALVKLVQVIQAAPVILFILVPSWLDSYSGNCTPSP